MAENEPAHQPQHKAAPKAAAKAAEPEEPKSKEELQDEGFVGVDPIYANVADAEPWGEPTSGTGDLKDEEKEAAEAEIEIIERVKENELGCVVEVDEPQPFEDWVSESALTERKSTKLGVDNERAEADRAKTEEAKNKDGKIPPRSTSTHQPGVNVVT